MPRAFGVVLVKEWPYGYNKIVYNDKGCVCYAIDAAPRAAVSLIPKGSVIADIGTDHAYIPVYTCETGWCPSAIAADIVPGPLAAARAHVEGAGLQDRIDCRLGDGLTVSKAGKPTAPSSAAWAVL